MHLATIAAFLLAGACGTQPAGPDAGPRDFASPCRVDGDCDDGIACTVDRCDLERGQCENAPDHTVCDDGDLCTGVEVCTPAAGCRAGAPLDCRDGDSCTTDSCDAELGCMNVLRDLDGDGYASLACEGGLDCDDDPLTGVDVNPDAEELCDDGVDNNCDGVADVFDFVSCAATNDACDSATDLPVGLVTFNSADMTHDYELSCDPVEDHVDLVFTFEVDAQRSTAIELGGALAIELREACADAESALGCAAASPESPRPRLEFLRRGLSPGTYHLIVSVPREPDIFSAELDLRGFPVPPRTDRCDESTPVIDEDTRVVGSFMDHRDSYPSLDCGGSAIAEDVAYRLELTEASDVTVTATGTTDGEPAGVRYAIVNDCSRPNDTALGCGATDDTLTDPLTLTGLPAGDYFLLLEGDEVDPVDEYELEVTIEPVP